MKLYRYIFLSLLAGLLFSCNIGEKWDDVDGPVPEPTPSQETGFVSLKISLLDETGTKADFEENAGKAAEQMVHSVRVVFYETFDYGCYVTELWDINATNVSGGSLSTFTGSDVATDQPATASSFYTVAHKMLRGNYKVVVIINPTNTLKIITEKYYPLSSIEGFASGLTEKSFTGENYTEFLMLNEQGPVQINATQHFYKKEEDAKANPLVVRTERAVAKIAFGVYGATITPLPLNSSFEEPRVVDLGSLMTKNSAAPDVRSSPIPMTVAFPMGLKGMFWQVDAVNLKSYWLRRMTTKGNGVMEQYGDTDRQNFYAEDPNFSGYASWTNSFLTSEFRYATFDTDISRGVVANTDYNCWSTAYVPENTMVADEQYHKLATRIIVKCVFESSYYSGGEIHGWNASTGTHFYSYIYTASNGTKYGVIIPLSTMQRYVEGSLSPGSYPGLSDAINAAKVQYPNFSTVPGNTPAFSTNNLNFYKSGVCYYTLPIKHFGQPAPNGYGKYGVVRNNVYRVGITAIKWPGSPTFPDSTGQIDTNDETVDMEAVMKMSTWEKQDEEITFN